LKQEVSVYDTAAMNYSPPTQSDYAPTLPDPHFSASAYTAKNGKPAEIATQDIINNANYLS